MNFHLFLTLNNVKALLESRFKNCPTTLGKFLVLFIQVEPEYLSAKTACPVPSTYLSGI
ncbi:hypothetical protein [Thermosipho melanesiensis]|uniref:hypothetical protein n=1 Tax=Thermosipho melanesiensis TaxID=46541 RepID=UPI0012DB051B|nr:hypothetical protein [Thermosipho melanesiensis]